MRAKFNEIVRASKLWDGVVLSFQVSETTEHTVELRGLVSARNSGLAWDLRCEVREKLIAFLQSEYPHALPRQRAEIELHREQHTHAAATGGQTRIRSPEIAPRE